MDIIALVISGISIFINIGIGFYFNKKFNTHETINRVKENMSIKKYEDEKLLYSDLQFHIAKLDNIINPQDIDRSIYRENNLSGYDKFTSHDMFIEYYLDKLNDYWLYHKANFTKSISEKINEIVIATANTWAAINDQKSNLSKCCNDVRYIREELYDLIRNRLDSIDVIEKMK